MAEKSWLQAFIWLYDYDTPTGALGYVAIAASVATVGWNIAEPAGVAGSPGLLGVLVLVGVCAALGVWVVASVLRWPLLFAAVKSHVKKHLLRELTEEKVLVGIGPGGAIAVGLVAKAVRVLGYEPPSVIVVDHKYGEVGSDPIIAILASNVHLPADRCWIIQGQIGTGRSLNKLRERLHLENAPVFAFVVSPDAIRRERVDALLAVGSRNILPWPTEQAPPRHEIKRKSDLNARVDR